MMEFTVPVIVQSVVLLLVRIVLVVVFLVEARVKFKDLKGFAKSHQLPFGAALVVATAELCAALGMASGILAQWAGVGIVVLMTCTIALHIFKWHSPYWASKRGWEYDLLLLVFGAVIAVFGAGQFAIHL